MVVDCHHSLGFCGERMKMSLKKKIRETPTFSPWVPFRAKFWHLGRQFRPGRPQAYSLHFQNKILAG